MLEFVIIVIITVAVIVTLVARANRAQTRKMRQEPSGSVRVESTKAAQVPILVRRYAREGWTAVDQSSAKSFLSEARVTVTFRKQ